MRLLLFLTMTGLGCLLSACAGKSGNEMRALFPRTVDNYVVVDTVSYNSETIFDYIDGAGEVYLSYGLKKVTVATYARPDSPDITAEIFEMGSSGDAYGVFSFSRESEESGIGGGFEFRSTLLKFWKGKYYISIQSMEIDEELKRTFLHLAKRIDSLLPPDGEKPSLLNFLPRENLIAGSEIYFHLFPILNNIYFVAESNILKLDKSTDAVLARYQPGAIYLLLVDYKSSERADTAYADFLSQYIKDPSGMVQTENGKWSGCVRKGNFLTVVFDAATKEDGQSLLDKTGTSLK